MKKIRGKAYAPESKKVQAHRDDLKWLKNDFEQAKKELENVKENQIKGISLDNFIYNKFSTRLDPIFYIENVLRAHLPASRQKLHSNQVELIRAVCNPRIRKVAGIMARQCFARDTKIIMSDLSYKNVQDIKIGDQVLTPDEKSAAVISTTSGQALLYKIVPTDGYNLPYIVTDNHRLSVSNHFSIKDNITVKDYINRYGYKSNEWRGYRHTLVNDNKPLTGFLKDYLINTNNKMEYLTQHLFHFIDICPNAEDELRQILTNSLTMRMDFIFNLVKMPYVLSNDIHNEYIIDIPLFLKDLFMRIIWTTGYKCKWQNNKIHMYKISSTTYSFRIEPYIVDDYYGFTIDSDDHLIILEDSTIGSNSGKTESISSFCGYLLDNYPNMRIGVFTPRIQQAEVTIGRLSIFYQMNEERLNNKLVKCTKQKIELSNNSYVSAVSASDQSNIEGLTFDIIVLDEAQKVSNYTWSERIMPMAGACVIGSTLCPLITGEYKTIKEIVDNKLVDKIPCIDINTGKQAIGSITDYCDIGKRETLKIVLASGRELIGTYEHPVIIKGNKWQRLDHLKIGDYIAIARELPYFGNVSQENARLLGMQISNKFEQVNWQQFNKSSLQEFVGGLFDANGYFSLKKSIAYTSIYKSLIIDIQIILQKFGINAYVYTKTKNKPYYTITIHGDKNIKLYYDNFKQLVTYKQNILDKIVTNVNVQTDNDLQFEKIISIKKNGLRHVYDLTVDHYHSFIANGIYVHNTNGKLIQIGTPKTHNHFYEAIEGREADQWKVIRKDWSQCEQLWALSATYLPDHEDPTHKRERPYSTFVLSLMPKSLKQEYFPTRPDIWTEGSMSVEDFKTQYMLQFVDGDSQFLTAEEMDKMKSGDFEWQDHSVYGEKYYAGIDFAGSSAGTSDFTHISIIRFDPLTQQKQKIYAIEMNGVSYPEQINVIDNLFGGFNPKFPCQAIFADFTGCGRPVVQTLIEERGIRQMTGITFNATDTFTHTGMNLKNAMFTYAKQEISYDRFKYPSLDNYLKTVSKDQIGFWHKQIGEWTDLLTEQRSALSINKIIHCPIGGHDDVTCADVLAIYASIVGNCANSMPKPVVARLIR